MPTSPKAKTKAEPKLLTWEEIQEADDRPIDTVTVPQWGGAVKIQAMSLRQRQDMRERIFTPEGEFDQNLWEDQQILQCVIEPEITPERLGLLKEKSADAVNTVVVAIQKLNKQGGGDLESAIAQFL